MSLVSVPRTPYEFGNLDRSDGPCLFSKQLFKIQVAVEKIPYIHRVCHDIDELRNASEWSQIVVIHAFSREKKKDDLLEAPRTKSTALSGMQFGKITDTWHAASTCQN